MRVGVEDFARNLLGAVASRRPNGIGELREVLSEALGKGTGLRMLDFPILRWRPLTVSVDATGCGPGLGRGDSILLPPSLGTVEEEVRVSEENSVTLRGPRDFARAWAGIISMYSRKGLQAVFVFSAAHPSATILYPLPPLPKTLGLPLQPLALVLLPLRLRDRLLGCRVRVSAEALIEHDRGYILEAVRDTGAGVGDEILVSAGFDQTVEKESQLAAVATAAAIWKALAERGRRARLVIVEGEYMGHPALPSWFWGYGSSYYASVYEALTLKSIWAIHVGVAPVAGRMGVWGPPFPAKMVAEAGNLEYFGSVNVWLSSYAFTQHRIPTLTLAPLNNPVATAPEGRGEGLQEALKASARLVEAISMLDPRRAGREILRHLAYMYSLNARSPWSLLTARTLYKILRRLRQDTGSEKEHSTTNTAVAMQVYQTLTIPIQILCREEVRVEASLTPVALLAQMLSEASRRKCSVTVANESTIVNATEQARRHILNHYDNLVSERLEQIYLNT